MIRGFVRPMLAFSKKRRAICMSACTTAFQPPFEQSGSVFVPNQAVLQCPEIEHFRMEHSSRTNSR